MAFELIITQYGQDFKAYCKIMSIRIDRDRMSTYLHQLVNGELAHRTSHRIQLPEDFNHTQDIPAFVYKSLWDSPEYKDAIDIFDEGQIKISRPRPEPEPESIKVTNSPIEGATEDETPN